MLSIEFEFLVSRAKTIVSIQMNKIADHLKKNENRGIEIEWIYEADDEDIGALGEICKGFFSDKGVSDMFKLISK